MVICRDFILSTCRKHDCKKYHPEQYVELIYQEMRVKNSYELCPYYSYGCGYASCSLLHVGLPSNHLDLIKKLTAWYPHSIHVCYKCYLNDKDHEPFWWCHQKNCYFHKEDSKVLHNGITNVCNDLTFHSFIHCRKIHFGTERTRIRFLLDGIRFNSIIELEDENIEKERLRKRIREQEEVEDVKRIREEEIRIHTKELEREIMRQEERRIAIDLERNKFNNMLETINEIISRFFPSKSIDEQTDQSIRYLIDAMGNVK